MKSKEDNIAGRPHNQVWRGSNRVQHVITQSHDILLRSELHFLSSF